MGKKIWITWEKQRRSIELSKRLGCDLYVLVCKRHYLIKSILNSIRTFYVLSKNKPTVLFVQNPSMILAFVACALKWIFKYMLVVDRHSNFKLESINSKRPKMWLFHLLSRSTIKYADITIVTNQFLCDLVMQWKGKGVILQDPLPVLDKVDKNKYCLNTMSNIVYICTYSEDEPYKEVINAAQLSPEKNFYITGATPKGLIEKYADIKNLHFTGYLSEDLYQSLLGHADVIIVLTTGEHILLCGAYEAISLCKPLIVSNTTALKAYFSKGVHYCNNTAPDIIEKIDSIFLNYEKSCELIRQFREELVRQWDMRFLDFVNELKKWHKN